MDHGSYPIAYCLSFYPLLLSRQKYHLPAFPLQRTMAGVKQHVFMTDGGGIMLDFKVLQKSVVRQIVLKKLPESRNVTLSASE